MCFKDGKFRWQNGCQIYVKRPKNPSNNSFHFNMAFSLTFFLGGILLYIIKFSFQYKYNVQKRMQAKILYESFRYLDFRVNGLWNVSVLFNFSTTSWGRRMCTGSERRFWISSYMHKMDFYCIAIFPPKISFSRQCLLGRQIFSDCLYMYYVYSWHCGAERVWCHGTERMVGMVPVPDRVLTEQRGKSAH